MDSQLSEVVFRKLKEDFPNLEINVNQTSPMFASIAPIYTEFGPVVLQDDRDEITIFVGNFTHAHFPCYEEKYSDEQRAQHIAQDVSEFLDDLFSDRLECYGSHLGGGGVRKRGHKGLFSRLFGPKKTYTWTGTESDA